MVTGLDCSVGLKDTYFKVGRLLLSEFDCFDFVSHYLPCTIIIYRTKSDYPKHPVTCYKAKPMSGLFRDVHVSYLL